MKLTPLVLLPVAATVLALTGCSSDDSGSSDSAAPTCPTDRPGSSDPQWTIDGATGSVSVTPATATTAPLIEVTTPFSVESTVVETITEGEGAKADDTDTLVVCYEGVNGTTGKTFDSSYERGETASFSPGGVVSGFKQALVGQKAGARVAVAMPPADGYGPDGNPGAEIGGDDTLIFEVHIIQVLAG